MDSSFGPEVTTHGPGDPELAVVAGLRGDEPGPVGALERLRGADLPLERGVKLVVAHPRALEAGDPFLESALERSFPGDADGTLEERLAAALREATVGLPTLALSATHSSPDPVAFAHRDQPSAFELAAGLPVDHVVEHHATTDGAYTATGEVAALETGGDDVDAAAETAHRAATAFLRANGALAGAAAPADPDFYALRDAVEGAPGAAYELLVENFQQVPTGEPFARADGRAMVAHWPFYPVLMGECGHEGVFGYRATRLGPSLDHVRAALWN